MMIYDWDDNKRECVVDCCAEEIDRCRDVVRKEMKRVEERECCVKSLERVMEELDGVEDKWYNFMREMCWGKKEDWKGGK